MLKMLIEQTYWTKFSNRIGKINICLNHILIITKKKNIYKISCNNKLMFPKLCSTYFFIEIPTNNIHRYYNEI